jgi:hypothetical protein
MTAPTPPDPGRANQIIQDAAADHLQQILDAQRWAVACLYISGGAPRIAAINIYDDFHAALAAYTDVSTELHDDPSNVVLMPVGPITEQEMEQSGLLDANHA